MKLFLIISMQLNVHNIYFIMLNLGGCSFFLVAKPIDTHGGVYFKTLRIHNLQETNRFHIKLQPFLLSVKYTSFYKHTSLDKHSS